MALVEQVGVGDVFVIAGQSNAMGPATNNQVNAFGVAGNYAKNGKWYKFADPSDTSQFGGVVYPVEDNTAGDPKGSVWPLVAGRFATNNLGFPIGFVPCSRDGSALSAWLPTGSHFDTTTLYGAMVTRATNIGGVKAVLWWQGESEAATCQSQSYYYTNFTNMTAALQADIGVKVIPCKLQHETNPSVPCLTAIQAAQAQAWANDPNTITGPDLSGITADDGIHLTSDSTVAAAAELWWNAIRTAFYP